MDCISRIPAVGNCCFIAVTLYEFSEISYLEQTLSKKLIQGDFEDSFSFSLREVLQSRFGHVVQKMKLGEEVFVEDILNIKDSLIDIGFLPRLNFIQKIFNRMFPGLSQYDTGDVFKLYNTVRYLCDAQDFHIGRAGFYKQLEGNPPSNSVVNLFVNPWEDFSFPQGIDFTLKVTMNCLKKRGLKKHENLKSRLGSKQLQFLQCTVPNKILGYHTFCFIRRGDRWYRCDYGQVCLSNIQSIEKVAKNALLHMHYF